MYPLLVIYTLIISIILIESCNIITVIESRTTKPFEFQIKVPNGEHSAMWKFDDTLQQKEFNATGRDCGKGMWSFDVYNNQTKLITSEKVLLDGVGAIALFVGDDMRPWFASRIGVLCLFGSCGSRG